MVDWFYENLTFLRFDSSWGLRSFSLSHVHDKIKKKRLSLFFYWAQNLPSFLIYLQNTTTLSTLLILPVCSMHVICEFCNGPSICFIRCVASGSSGHIRESAPLQLWDINRWADSYHDYGILTEIFKLKCVLNSLS